MISMTTIGSIGYLITIIIIYRMVFVEPKNCLDWDVSKWDKWIAIAFMSYFMLCFILCWVSYVLGVVYEIY